MHKRIMNLIFHFLAIDDLLLKFLLKWVFTVIFNNIEYVRRYELSDIQVIGNLVKHVFRVGQTRYTVFVSLVLYELEYLQRVLLDGCLEPVEDLFRVVGQDAVDDEVDEAEHTFRGRVDAEGAVEGEFGLEEVGKVGFADGEHLAFVDVAKAHHGEDLIGDVVCCLVLLF